MNDVLNQINQGIVLTDTFHVNSFFCPCFNFCESRLKNSTRRPDRRVIVHYLFLVSTNFSKQSFVQFKNEYSSLFVIPIRDNVHNLIPQR